MSEDFDLEGGKGQADADFSYYFFIEIKKLTIFRYLKAYSVDDSQRSQHEFLGISIGARRC